VSETTTPGVFEGTNSCGRVFLWRSKNGSDLRVEDGRLVLDSETGGRALDVGLADIVELHGPTISFRGIRPYIDVETDEGRGLSMFGWPSRNRQALFFCCVMGIALIGQRLSESIWTVFISLAFGMAAGLLIETLLTFKHLQGVTDRATALIGQGAGEGSA